MAENESAHALNTNVRPAACSCGSAQYAGSPTFVRARHAIHVQEAADAAEAAR